jgi:hypothetical protein
MHGNMNVKFVVSVFLGSMWCSSGYISYLITHQESLWLAYKESSHNILIVNGMPLKLL